MSKSPSIAGLLGIQWHPPGVGAGLRLHAGEVEVGYVEYDGGNRMWVWSSRLADDAWGWGSTEQAAKNGLEAWLSRLA